MAFTGFEPGTCGLVAEDLAMGATTPMKYINWLYIFTQEAVLYYTIISSQRKQL